MDDIQQCFVTNHYDIIKTFNDFDNELLQKSNSYPEIQETQLMEFIDILPNGFLPENKGYITVLRNFSPKCEEYDILTYTCILSVLDVLGNNTFPKSFYFEISKENNTYEDNVEEKYIERNAILNNASEFLRNNTLTISIDETISGWKKIPRGTRPIPITSENESYFFDLIENQKGCIQYTLSESEINKLNLCSKSGYFRCLISTQLLENITRYAIIEEEDIYAFLSMLRFINKGILYLKDISVYDLYIIADKYDVQSLVKKCRDNIIDSMTDENVSHILKFASFFKDTKLQKAVEKYLETESLEIQVGEIELSELFNLEDKPPLHTLSSIGSPDKRVGLIQQSGIKCLMITFLDIHEGFSISKQKNFDFLV